MILEQYYLGCLSQASYLVGDPVSGVGAVVDPRRDVDEYVEEAKRLGLTIRHILLTHLHADFLSGHLELAHATGAAIHLGAQAETDYPMIPMADGGMLSLGNVYLKFLETPGHTPESICILAYPDAEAPSPHAVLTGDTLFIGSVGRPDLLVSIGHTAEDLAEQLYDSLHEKLMTLPDETLVYPGHGAGSACGKGLSTDTVSTIGAQRATNFMLQIKSRDAFIKEVTGDQPPQPQYFAFDATQNKKNRPLLDELLADLRSYTLDEALAHHQSGGVILDVRDAEAFSKNHLRGSFGIGLGGRFASWAGTFLKPEDDIVLVAEPGQEQEATTRLARIGYDRVVGYVDGGIGAAPGNGQIQTSFERVDSDSLEKTMESGRPHVIDIRAASEWEAGHIGDTPNIPLENLEQHLPQIPKDKPVVLVCQSGYRSIIGASLLEINGYENVTDLRGGFLAWSSRTGVR